MKRKELEALFSEVSSKCQPIRGIYTADATERERLIRAELKQFAEKELEEKEKEALEELFLAYVQSFTSHEEFRSWFHLMKKSYSPHKIPDRIYVKFLSISLGQNFDLVTELLREYVKPTK